MKKIEANHNGIFYLQADVNYTIIYYCDGSKVVSSFTLKKHEAILKNHNFLRINKSQLVNQGFIESVEMERTSCLVRLTNGACFRSSRRKTGILKVLTVN